MVDLTRRKTVIGLGLLATGSGATFTSAAFQSSTQPDADLRVVVDQNLQFGANPDYPDDDDNITDDPDFFEDGELNEDDGGPFDQGNETANPDPSTTNGSGTGGDDGYDPDDPNDDGGFNEGFEPELPKAFAGGINGEFGIRAAVQIGDDARFSELLQVSNETDGTVEVGIAYDRNGDPESSANGNYGADVNLGSTYDGAGPGELTGNQAQKIYQFQTSGQQDLISPAPEEDGLPGDSSGVTIDNSGDRPGGLVTLDPGESVNLDLVVNATDNTGPSEGTGSDLNVEDSIFDAADIEEGAFGFQTDTVQIMDVITVVSQPV